jgi:DNA polymerase-3 subunit delta
MMGDKQVIIVKEAQDLKFNEEENRILEAYVENPVPSTVLVLLINTKNWTAERKLPKLWIKQMLFLSESVRKAIFPNGLLTNVFSLRLKPRPIFHIFWQNIWEMTFQELPMS